MVLGMCTLILTKSDEHLAMASLLVHWQPCAGIMWKSRYLQEPVLKSSWRHKYHYNDLIQIGFNGFNWQVYSIISDKQKLPKSKLRTIYNKVVWQHTFVSPSAFSRRAVVCCWRKYVHEILVNRLGGLSLPRKSVVRLTDRPDMTLDVYRGRKTTMQQQIYSFCLYVDVSNPSVNKTF